MADMELGIGFVTEGAEAAKQAIDHVAEAEEKLTRVLIRRAKAEDKVGKYKKNTYDELVHQLTRVTTGLNAADTATERYDRKMDKLSNVMKNTKEDMKGLVKTLTEKYGITVKNVGSIKQLVNQEAMLEGKVKATQARYKEMLKHYGLTHKEIRKLVSEEKRLGDETKKASDKMKYMKEGMHRNSKAALEYNDAVKKLKDSKAALAHYQINHQPELKAYKQLEMAQRKLKENQKMWSDKDIVKVKKLIKTYDKLGKELIETEKNIKKFKQGTKESMDAMRKSERILEKKRKTLNAIADKHFEEMKAVNKSKKANDRLTAAYERQQRAMKDLKMLRENLKGKGLTKAAGVADAELKALERNNLGMMAQGAVYGKGVDLGKIEKAEKALLKTDKTMEKLNKTVRKGTSIFNTWFGRMSMVMTSIAATIFVIQNLIRWIRAFYDATLDLEKALIKVQMTVGGTKQELKEMTKAAREASESGYKTTAKNVEEMVKLRKAGHSAATAMAALKLASLEYAQASIGTLSAEIATFSNTIKNFTIDLADIFSDDLKNFLDRISTNLKSVMEYMTRIKELREGGVELDKHPNALIARRYTPEYPQWKAAADHVNAPPEEKKLYKMNFEMWNKLFVKLGIIDNTIKHGGSQTSAERQARDSSTGYDIISPDYAQEEANRIALETLELAKAAAAVRQATLDVQKEANEDNLWYKVAKYTESERASNRRKAKDEGRTVDADTIVLMVAGKKHSIRLKSVDGPESAATDERRGTQDSFGRIVDNTVAGLLASFSFKKMMSGQDVKLDFEGVDKYDRWLGDNMMNKSGFKPVDIMKSMGLVGSMNYQMVGGKQVGSFTDPKYTAPEDSERAAFAKARLSLIEAKYADYEKSLGLDRGYNQADYSDADWQKKTKIQSDLAEEYKAFADLYGFSGAEKQFMAWNKEVAAANKILKMHEDVLKKTGTQSKLYNLTVATQIEDQHRQNIEAGVDPTTAGLISSEATEEARLKTLENNAAKMSELEIKYAVETEEATLTVNAEYQKRREQARENEASRISWYTTDVAATQKALRIKEHKETIEDLKRHGAAQTEVFSKTGMASPEYLDNLEDTLAQVNAIYLEQTGDRKGYTELVAKAQITIAEATAKREIAIFAMTNVATQEYLEKRKKIIQTKSAEIFLVTGNQFAKDIYELEEVNKEIKKAYADRAEVVNAFYSMTGKVTQDFYDEEARTINDQALLYRMKLEKQGYGDAKGIATAWRNLKLLNLEVKNLRSSSDIMRGFSLGVTGIAEQTKSYAENMYEFGKASREVFKSSVKEGLSESIIEGLEKGTFYGLNIWEKFTKDIIKLWSDMLVEQMATWVSNQAKMGAVKAGGAIVDYQKGGGGLLDLFKNLGNLTGGKTDMLNPSSMGGGNMPGGMAGGGGAAYSATGGGAAGGGASAASGGYAAAGGGYMGSTAAGGMNSAVAGGSSAGGGMAAGAGVAAFVVVGAMILAKGFSDQKDQADKQKAEQKAIRENLIAINANTAATKDTLTRQLRVLRGEDATGTSSSYEAAIKTFENIITQTTRGTRVSMAEGWDITTGTKDIKRTRRGSSWNDLYLETMKTQTEALEIVFLKLQLAFENLAASIEDAKDQFINEKTSYEQEFETIGASFKRLREGEGGTEETLADYRDILTKLSVQESHLKYWQNTSAEEEVGSQVITINTGSGMDPINTSIRFNPDGSYELVSGGGGGTGQDYSPPSWESADPGDRDGRTSALEGSIVFRKASGLYNKMLSDSAFWIGQQVTIYQDNVDALKLLLPSQEQLAEAYGITGVELEAVLKAEERFMIARMDVWEGIRRYMRTTTGVADELEQALWGVDDQFKGWIESLLNLGAAQEEITRVQELWTKAIQATILNQQISDIESGGSSIEGLLDRLKGILESRITSDFGIEDWTQIFYRAGRSLDLLSAEDYEDQSEYWADIVDLSTLQLDALNNIITLTEQEIGNLEGSKDSIDSLLRDMRGGSLAAGTSADYIQNEYDRMFLAASAPGASSEAVNEFLNYVPDYLSQMKEFGVDYGSLVTQSISDVEAVDANVTATLDDLLTELTDIATATGGLDDSLGFRLDTLIGYISGSDGLGTLNDAVSNDVSGLAGILANGFKDLMLESETSIAFLKDVLEGLMPDDSEFIPGANASGWIDIDGVLAKSITTDSIIITDPVDVPTANPTYGIPTANPTYGSGSFSEFGFASGGLTRGLSFAGEKGSEWIIPTYEPERTSFLNSINMSPQNIASEISSNMEGGNNGPMYITVEIGGEKFGTAMVQNMKSNREVRKQVKKVSNG